MDRQITAFLVNEICLSLSIVIEPIFHKLSHHNDRLVDFFFQSQEPKFNVRNFAN